MFAYSGPVEHRRATKVGRAAELAVLGILILAFIVIAANRIWMLRVAAERNGVAHTEGALRTALAFRVVEIALKKSYAEVGSLAGSNPMLLLEPKRLPPNYLGELRSPDLAMLPGYHWYFDPETGQLVYLVGNPEAVDSGLASPPRVAWRIAAHYRDLNGNGVFDPALEYADNVILEPVVPFAWREP